MPSGPWGGRLGTPCSAPAQASTRHPLHPPAPTWSSETPDPPAESDGDVDGVDEESSAESCRSGGSLPPLCTRVCAASWTLPLNTLRAALAATASKPMYTSWGNREYRGPTAQSGRSPHGRRGQGSLILVARVQGEKFKTHRTPGPLASSANVHMGQLGKEGGGPGPTALGSHLGKAASSSQRMCCPSA